MERLEREKEFHDKRFSKKEQKSNLYEFGLNNWYKKYIELILKSNESTLEIGAGMESCFIEYPVLRKNLSRSNAKITSIDISYVSVKKCNELNLKNIKFIVEDAHELNNIEDFSFSKIVGRGIIHHLNISKFTNTLKSKAGKNCKYIFAEPMVGPFYIRLYRFFTPNLRTVDEQPLRIKDIKLIENSFLGKKNRIYYGFLTIPFALIGIKSKLIETLDYFILNKLRLGRILAWAVIISNV